MTGDADRLIGRLPVDRRRIVLDAIAHATKHGSTVAVEHTQDRKLAEATTTIGRIIGVAYAPGGGADLVLVLDPVRPDRRMLALPAAHVCRVRWAHEPTGTRPGDPSAYDLGAVIAGPPLESAQTA